MSESEGDRDRLQRLAEMGDPLAMRELGTSWYDADPDTSKQWWQRAAALGDGPAMRHLGSLAYRQGDQSGAIVWFEKAAVAGDGPAAVSRGSLCGPRERSEALRWYQMAAERGETEGKVRLANLLLKRDPETAWKWIEQAAGEGHPWAAARLVRRFSLRHPTAGRRTSPHYEEFLELIRAAAEAGDPQNMSTLGNLLMVDNKDDEAREWLEKAAAVGIETGKFGLQVLDLDGTTRPEAGPLARGGLRALIEVVPKPRWRTRRR